MSVELNLDGLDRLKDLGGKKVKIGILGNGDSRDDGLSNATLGLVHEMGSKTNNIPDRSFLRMPLLKKSKELLSFMSKGVVQKALIEGDEEKALSFVGLKAEDIISQAFKTRGFGSWTPLKKATVKAKGSSQPLIDTRELQRSISSEVKDGGNN